MQQEWGEAHVAGAMWVDGIQSCCFGARWCRETPGILCMRGGPLSLGELGHGLGALGHGVLGELTRKHQAHRGLDVAAANGETLVNAAELRRLQGHLLKRVRHEVVDDRHALLGDARLRVHLLEHTEDVRLPGLDATALNLLGGRVLGGGLLRHGLRHDCKVNKRSDNEALQLQITLQPPQTSGTVPRKYGWPMAAKPSGRMIA